MPGVRKMALEKPADVLFHKHLPAQLDNLKQQIKKQEKDSKAINFSTEPTKEVQHEINPPIKSENEQMA